MCIIAIKPAGVKMPDENIRKNMWYGNPHGAGFMYPCEGGVRIEKGFMTLSAMEERLAELGDLTDRTVVMHYRITTHGGTTPENCHPFPITDNTTVLGKPVIRTNIGVAHNGIIHSVTPRKGISDTMEYIASQLYWAKKIDRYFYLDENWLSLIEEAIDSKMVFLDQSGKFTTIGKFEEDDGVLYSNRSYEYAPTKGKYTFLGSPYSYDLYEEDEPDDAMFYKDLMLLDDWSFFNNKNYVVRSTDADDPYKYGYEDDVCAIDSKGNLYYYEWNLDVYIPFTADVRAYEKDGGRRIKFNADYASTVPVDIA